MSTYIIKTKLNLKKDSVLPCLKKYELRNSDKDFAFYKEKAYFSRRTWQKPSEILQEIRREKYKMMFVNRRKKVEHLYLILTGKIFLYLFNLVYDYFIRNVVIRKTLPNYDRWRSSSWTADFSMTT